MTVTYIEIDSDKRDTTSYTNPYSFNISTNTSSSTAETGQLIGGTQTTRINTRQYEVRLLELTIPWLNNLTFYKLPYLYVKFGNPTVDTSHFFSNNDSSVGKYFRVPLGTGFNQSVPEIIYSTFQSNMTQIINLSLQENLTFEVRLPDNSQVTPIAPTATPYACTAAATTRQFFNLTIATNYVNFKPGNVVNFSAGPTGDYIVSDVTTLGVISILPYLNADIGGGTTVTNVTNTFDRVTALFELKQIVKY